MIVEVGRCSICEGPVVGERPFVTGADHCTHCGAFRADSLVLMVESSMRDKANSPSPSLSSLAASFVKEFIA